MEEGSEHVLVSKLAMRASIHCDNLTIGREKGVRSNKILREGKAC